MLTVTGGSDDLIIIGGDTSREFGATGDTEGEGAYLAFSDGTLLRIKYDEDGIWRITRIISGSALFSKVEGDVDADTFDVVTLNGVIRWVVLGEDFGT